jgi:hypothetical protein
MDDVQREIALIWAESRQKLWTMMSKSVPSQFIKTAS